MKILHLGRIPIKSWADHIEDGALQQAENMSNLPFAYKHIALMADVHEGYGMPIGGVLAAKKMIIPNAVGVDIGCGVKAGKTDITEISQEKIKKIIQTGYKLIPVGFKHHKKPQNWDGFKYIPKTKIFNQELESAMHQIGTLGGGNHFCSIEKANDGHIWIMVHSGSRNLGYKVASYYNKIAKELNKKTKAVPPGYDLAPLPVDSSAGKEYFEAMNYCLEFARANREMLFNIFYQIFRQETASTSLLEEIDIHHNYAAVETHFREEVFLHRKGATSAKKHQLGVIPGSMGTASYIIEGLGNPDSFMSCSHGAGRAISRTEANKLFTKQMVDKAMEGIVFNGRRGDYSEAPMAYKDIDAVVKNQSDLVKTLVRMTPLGVMKG